MPGSIGQWLETIGFSKYLGIFIENKIDLDVLPELTDDDLKGLGIPLGDRKRLLNAMASPLDLPGGPVAGGASPVSSTTAERRQLTVMFVDLVDATALSERLDPEDLREVIGHQRRRLGAQRSLIRPSLQKDCGRIGPFLKVELDLNFGHVCGGRSWPSTVCLFQYHGGTIRFPKPPQGLRSEGPR